MSAIAVPNPPRPRARDHEIAVQLAGVSATLSSDFAPFIEYAREHVAPLQAAPTFTPQVRARLTWHEGAPPRTPEIVAAFVGWNRVDRDLYRRGNQLAWFRIDDFPDLHLRLEWDGNQLVVEGDYYHRLSKTPSRDWLSRMLYRRRLPTLRRRRFTTLIYYLTYYPVFWWLEHHGHGHPIHAGGVERPGGIVVLAGPSGVGKSTLVTGLASDDNARMLSDTFLVHKGAAVRGVPEPLLLDQWSRNWLGAHASLLQPVRHIYSLHRDGFHWPDRLLASGGDARVLIFPQRAPSHYITPLAPSSAQGRIRAGDLIVNDVRRYWAYASILELLDPSPLVQAREQSLAALVSSVPAFEVGLTTDVARTEIAAMIDRLLAESATPSLFQSSAGA